MALREKDFQSGLETLRHGGHDAIAIFVKMSRALHESGTDEDLRNWITIAAPALPEAERGEVLLMLMNAFLHASTDIPVRILRARDPARTVH
jgi:hypothetical protein